jgi:transcriptional regulator with XRE-family HTH domain
MSHVKFGQLIAALRKEKFDPVSGHPWSQQSLADASGISPRIIATIEQGTKANIDVDTLLRLAKALRLNTLEKRMFFLLASASDIQATSAVSLNEALQVLLSLMKNLRLPALVYDDYMDILAVNSLSVAFNIGVAQAAGITAPFPITREHNLLRLLFAPDSEHRQRLAPMWSVMAQACVQLFHCNTMRHRSSPYFQSLLSQLRQYPTFRQHWDEVCDSAPIEVGNCHPFHIADPQRGTTEWCNSIITTATPIADLHLSVVLPCNQAAFEALAVGIKVVQMEVYQLEERPTADKFAELANAMPGNSNLPQDQC